MQNKDLIKLDYPSELSSYLGAHSSCDPIISLQQKNIYQLLAGYIYLREVWRDNR